MKKNLSIFVKALSLLTLFFISLPVNIPVCGRRLPKQTHSIHCGMGAGSLRGSES